MIFQIEPIVKTLPLGGSDHNLFLQHAGRCFKSKRTDKVRFAIFRPVGCNIKSGFNEIAYQQTEKAIL